jgi:hypothetical protein
VARRLIGWAVGLVALAVAVWLIVTLVRGILDPDPPPPFGGPADTLPDAEVLDDRPSSAPPGIVERIVTVYVPVDRVVTVTLPDTALAERYATLARDYRRWRIQREQDSLAGRALDTTPPPPSILPPVTLRYDGRRLRLHLTETSGRVMRATARVRPRFAVLVGQGGVSDTLPLVRQDRWFVREAREGAGCVWRAAAPGAVAGAVVSGDDRLGGAAIGAGLAFLACMAD